MATTLNIPGIVETLTTDVIAYTQVQLDGATWRIERLRDGTWRTTRNGETAICWSKAEMIFETESHAVINGYVGAARKAA